MGEKSNTKKYEVAVQLLILSAAVLTPFMAFNFMDLELLFVSKTMFKTLWSSVNPWLYPPYVYLLINFIIFFIFASSFIHSNTNYFNSATYHNHPQRDSFTGSSLVYQNLEVGTSSHDEIKFRTVEDTLKDLNDNLQFQQLEDTFKDVNDDLRFHKLEDTLKEVVPDSLVAKRELRKSKTFHEGRSRPIGRRERYVRILSQDELDRRVEAFICRFKKAKIEG